MARSSSWFLPLGLLAFASVICSTNGCIGGLDVLDLEIDDKSVFEIGSEIRVNCSLRSNKFVSSDGWETHVDHSNLRFRSQRRMYDETDGVMQKVDNNTIAFVVENATVEDSKQIMCFGVGPDKDGNTTMYPGCYNTIAVGKRPQKIINFKCTSTSFVNMTCTWEIPENKVETTYTVESSSGVHRAFSARWVICPAEFATSTSCTWTDSTVPPLDKMAHEFYFRINGTNALGRESWDFRLSHGSIVKLSPVKKLNVRMKSTRQVNITWEAPDETKHGGWKELLPIEYSLSINRAHDNDSEVIETSSRFLSFSNLVPNKQYEIAVRARTNATQRFDLYSDPQTSTFTMAKDKPDKPPTLLPSAFKYKLFNSVRTVTLLFDEIPPTYWNDDTFEYIVQICSRADEMCYNRTTKTSHFDLEELSVSKRYYIDVWSSNSLGRSSSSSGIVIGPQSELLPSPTDVVVLLGYRNVSLSWKTPQTLEEYGSLNADIYWCESHDQQRCRGKLHSMQVSNNDSVRIEVNEPRDFIYGVALSEPNGRTSGSVWSVCEINPGAHVGQVRELEALPHTDTTLKLRWRTGCGYQRKDVEGYQVQYCRLERESRTVVRYADECQHRTAANVSAACRVLNFTIPTEEDVFVLRGLEKGATYRVVLRAIDGVTHKFAPDSMAVCAIAQSTGLTPHVVVLIAVSSVCGILLLFLILFFCARKTQVGLDLLRKFGVHLPNKMTEEKLKQVQNNGVELKVLATNGLFNTGTEEHNGSLSSLDQLIAAKGRDPVEATKRVSERLNLMAESRAAAFVAAQQQNAMLRSAMAAHCVAPAQPYSQLGLSASHFVAAPDHLKATGYSQLAVVPDGCSVTEVEDDQQQEDEEEEEYDEEENCDEDEEERAHSPELGVSVRSSESSNYIPYEMTYDKNTTPPYVAVVRANK